MASSSQQRLIALLAVVAVLVPSVSAVEFIVGDEKGWTNINTDYQAWAQGKEFHVGDKLGKIHNSLSQYQCNKGLQN